MNRRDGSASLWRSVAWSPARRIYCHEDLRATRRRRTPWCQQFVGVGLVRRRLLAESGFTDRILQEPVETSPACGVGTDQGQNSVRIPKLGENVFEHRPAPAVTYAFVPAHDLGSQIRMPL